MRLVALDWVNFLLADVRGGLGAYVIVYLVTRAHWSQATVGAVLTVSGLTGIMLHPSVGVLASETYRLTCACFYGRVATKRRGIATPRRV